MLKSLLEFDFEFSEKIRIKTEKTLLWYVTSWMAHSGDSWYWLGGLPLIWLLSNGEWHNRAALILIGIFFEIVVVFALKFIIRRKRPEGEWGNFYRMTDPHSFPSGHAARAGLVAAMAVGLGPLWFSIAAVIWAPLLALSRAAMGVHYLVDIIAGLIVGILTGILVLRLIPLWQTLLPFLFI